MNAAAFYILGALVLAGAVAAVGMPRTREAATGLLALTTAAGILAMASSAFFTGAIEIVLSGLAITGIALAIRRGGYGHMAVAPRLSVRSTVLSGAIAAAFVVVLLVALAGNGSDWHSGGGGAALVTLLHYRVPFAAVAAVVALVVGVAGALLVGRPGEDELEYDRTHEARRLREERTERRRSDREAARRRRRASIEGQG